MKKTDEIKSILYGDRLYYSSTGYSGTTPPIGTKEYPSNSIANLNTIAGAYGIKKYIFLTDCTLDAAPTAGVTVEGLTRFTIVTMNNKDVNGVTFRHALLTGIQGGAGTAFIGIDCTIYSVLGLNATLFNCDFMGASVLYAGSIQWWYGIKGTSSAEINCTGFNANLIEILGFTGYMEISNLADALSTIDIYGGGGHTKISASNTAGIIKLYGILSYTLGGGGVTVNNKTINVDISAIRSQTDKLAGAAPAGSTTANWNGGTATSGQPGADLVTIGANDTKYKVLSLLISLHNLTHGATITARMYMQINGTERQISFGGNPTLTFIAGTDPDGQPLIDGVWGIHEALRIELYSDTAADDGKSVDYDYMREEM